MRVLGLRLRSFCLVYCLCIVEEVQKVICRSSMLYLMRRRRSRLRIKKRRGEMQGGAQPAPPRFTKLEEAFSKVSIPYRKFFKNEPLQANFKRRGPGRAPGRLQASAMLWRVSPSKKFQVGRSLSKSLNSVQKIL